MTIHGPIEPDPEPDPIYDAVGRAVESATAVENWLNVLASYLIDTVWDQEPWSRISEKVRAGLRERLLPEHQSQVEALLTEAERLLEVRNGLVHGVWLWGHTRAGEFGFESQRRPRNKDAEMIEGPNGEPVRRWTKQTFTRERLLAFANDCQRVAATAQFRIMKWTEHLDPDEKDGP